MIFSSAFPVPVRCQTHGPLPWAGRLEDFRLARIHALAELGPSLLEVRGYLVIRHARRLSDHLNHPDPMLEVDAGELRHQGEDFWEEVAGLSLNRNRVLAVIPVDDADPGPDPGALVPAHHIRVKIICRGMSVVGFVTLPLQATMSTFIHETRQRFLAVQQARLVATPDAFSTDTGMLPCCLVNRDHIVACVETRPGTRRAPDPPGAGESS